MAGTIAGLPLSQRFDIETGEFLSGGLLYVYAAGTSTPVSTFEDVALSLELPFPIELDSGGQIPMFWLADGQYRVVLRNADGVTQFDESSVLAIGSSDTTVTGGDSVDANSVLLTGDFLWRPTAGARTGFVRANGRTIGAAASGATERANADTEDLYLFLWNNFSDTDCAVATGRGGSAAADFASNKAIATLDMRDCLAWGASGMGNTSTGNLSDTAAASVGALTKTISQGNLPSVNFDLSSLTGSVGTSITNGTLVERNVSTGSANITGAGSPYLASGSAVTVSLASGTVTFGGSIPSGGSGTALDVASKGRVGTWFIKL